MKKTQNEKAAKKAANWWGKRLESGDKKIFIQTLEKLILSELNDKGNCFTYCDYDPQGILLKAVNACGNNCSGICFSANGILPCKTDLMIYPDRLEPKEGYGNWVEHIKV